MNAKPGSLRAGLRPTTHKIQSTQLHPISGWYLLYMRLCDIVVTDVALWLATRIRQVLPFGPALYRQRRLGEGGKEFRMFKLRTMVCGPDQHEVHLLLNQNGSLRFNKQPDVPRVTRVGKFLCRWSIDELPQLLNVLKGGMSLIGPG